MLTVASMRSSRRSLHDSAAAPLPHVPRSSLHSPVGGTEAGHQSSKIPRRCSLLAALRPPLPILVLVPGEAALAAKPTVAGTTPRRAKAKARKTSTGPPCLLGIASARPRIRGLAWSRPAHAVVSCSIARCSLARCFVIWCSVAERPLVRRAASLRRSGCAWSVSTVGLHISRAATTPWTTATVRAYTATSDVGPVRPRPCPHQPVCARRRRFRLGLRLRRVCPHDC